MTWFTKGPKKNLKLFYNFLDFIPSLYRFNISLSWQLLQQQITKQKAIFALCKSQISHNSVVFFWYYTECDDKNFLFSTDSSKSRKKKIQDRLKSCLDACKSNDKNNCEWNFKFENRHQNASLGRNGSFFVNICLQFPQWFFFIYKMRKKKLIAFGCIEFIPWMHSKVDYFYFF